MHLADNPLTRVVCYRGPQVATTNLVVEGFVLANPPIAHIHDHSDLLGNA
jgi:hypothetical protein